MSSLLTDSIIAGGKLRVKRKIGEGGMGAVYEVEHLLTGHRRALKVLLPEFGEHEEVIERFRMEATVAARLKTKAVVQTFDAGLLEDGSPYLLMEMLDGKPLDELIEPLLELSQLASIMSEACEALHEAHQVGVVHRDIKPDNLFVCADGVKVLDFGISKFLGQEAETKTVDGMALGTPHYMSPEQARGQNDLLDHRTDIFSLGVVLFECLTGVKPFDGTFPAIIIAISTGTRSRACDHRGDLSSAWDDVIDRALAEDPDDRFASMLEFSQAIQDASQSIVTLPVLPRRSYKAWLGSAAVLALVGVGFWLSSGSSPAPEQSPPVVHVAAPSSVEEESTVLQSELPMGVVAPANIERDTDPVGSTSVSPSRPTPRNPLPPTVPTARPTDVSPPPAAPTVPTPAVAPALAAPVAPADTASETVMAPGSVGELDRLDRDNPYGD